MSISSRSTKAELLAALAAQEATIAAGPTWGQVWAKFGRVVSTVSREIALLARDLTSGWRKGRAWYDHAMAELTRPIFKM